MFKCVEQFVSTKNSNQQLILFGKSKMYNRIRKKNGLELSLFIKFTCVFVDHLPK